MSAHVADLISEERATRLVVDNLRSSRDAVVDSITSDSELLDYFRNIITPPGEFAVGASELNIDGMSVELYAAWMKILKKEK